MTVQTTSLLPQMSGAYLPPPSPTSGLSPGERAAVGLLQNKLSLSTFHMTLCQTYYDGTQQLANLGVSIPPGLSGLRTVVDWPRICVDPLVERATIDGFRLPGETESDSELWEFWQANNMDAEFPLVALDSLTLGRGFAIIGQEDGDPLITVESPFNLAANWDPRIRKITAAYQSYFVEGIYRAALYLPDVTIQMSRSETSPWRVDDRDEHQFGEVPVVRFPNRQKSSDREGRSEITPAVRNITDAAVRTLLGMEIAREFYSVPHRYGLGLAESDFVNPDGSAKAAIEMVMSAFIAFERDAQGNVPTVGQFQAFDPSVFTKIIDKHAMLMSSFTQYPPEYFGQTNTANPASADAIRSAQDGLNRRGRQVQRQFSDPAEQVMRRAWRMANGGQDVPAEFRRMETDWSPVATPTPSATADALAKQISAGMIPPTSDVTLAAAGYSAVERARLKNDRAADVVGQEIAEVASSLEVKDLRATKALTADAEPTTPTVSGQ